MAIQDFTAGQVLTAVQMDNLQANDYNQTVSTKTASYTLVAADKGTRVVMNSASATTITVNTSLFSAGDTLILQNISTGVCTVTAGTATVSSAGSLAIPQNGSGILYFTSAGVSIYYPSAVTASAAGLVCVKAETAFTTASSVTVDNVFTSTYTNYLLVVRYFTSTTNNPSIQMRVGGVTASTNYNVQYFAGVNTVLDAGRATAQTSAAIFRSTNGDFKTLSSLQINGPFLAEPTLFAIQSSCEDGAYTAPISQQNTGNHSTATSYDGFILSVATGTFTGIYTVYGYSKAV
jgi:hypothetical protein